MVVGKKEFEHAYSPYWKESLYRLVINTFVFVVCALIVAAVNIHVLMYPFMFLLLFLLPVFTEYKISILSLLEIKKGAFEEKEIFISQINTEEALTGKWENAVTKIYPKEIRVDRYKLICFDSNDNKTVLRCVLGKQNCKLIAEKLWEEKTLKQTVFKRTVIYGKYSKVIVKYLDKDDVSFLLNRRL